MIGKFERLCCGADDERGGFWLLELRRRGPDDRARWCALLESSCGLVRRPVVNRVREERVEEKKDMELVVEGVVVVRKKKGELPERVSC